MCVFLYIHAQCVYSCLMCVCLVLLRGLRADINEASLCRALSVQQAPNVINNCLASLVCVSMCVFLCARTTYDAITYVFCESLLEPA